MNGTEGILLLLIIALGAGLAVSVRNGNRKTERITAMKKAKNENEKHDEKMWLNDRNDTLKRVGEALISIARIASDMESTSTGNVIGKVNNIDSKAGTVEVVIESLGCHDRKLRFNLDASINASLGLEKDDVVLQEIR